MLADIQNGAGYGPELSNLISLGCALSGWLGYRPPVVPSNIPISSFQGK